MIWVAKNLYFFNCLLDGAHTMIQRNRLFYIIENYVLTNESAEPSSRISMVGVCQCDKKIIMDIFDKKCSLCDKFDKVQEIKMLYN
jgi:hypothetical protein